MNTELTKDEFLLLFGKQLAVARKQKNLSYRKLAMNCDIDYSDISKIEKGKVNVTLNTIFELAKGLNTHPQAFFNFEFDVDLE